MSRRRPDQCKAPLILQPAPDASQVTSDVSPKGQHCICSAVSWKRSSAVCRSMKNSFIFLDITHRDKHTFYFISSIEIEKSCL
jgi:hypothetical protein